MGGCPVAEGWARALTIKASQLAGVPKLCGDRDGLTHLHVGLSAGRKAPHGLETAWQGEPLQVLLPCLQPTLTPTSCLPWPPKTSRDTYPSSSAVSM